MIDAALTIGIALVVLVSLALAADIYGDWHDRHRRDDGLDAVRRRDEQLRALERTVWGRRGR